MDRSAIFIFEPAASIRDTISASLLGCDFEVVRVEEKSLLIRLLDSRAANAVVLGHPRSIRPSRLTLLIRSANLPVPFH
jgi:hypothetical protein